MKVTTRFSFLSFNTFDFWNSSVLTIKINTTFRPNFGYFQVNTKNVTMNIYMRERRYFFLENRNIQREEIINDNDNDKPNSPSSITRSCDCSLNLTRLFPQYCLSALLIPERFSVNEFIFGFHVTMFSPKAKLYFLLWQGG